MLGNFDETVSVKDFLHHADTGIGTCAGLDGDDVQLITEADSGYVLKFRAVELWERLRQWLGK